MREETNDTESRKTIVRNSDTASWFFEKIDKRDKPVYS